MVTCDAWIKLEERVSEHALVELADVVGLVPPTPVEAPRALVPSFARRPRGGRTRAPPGTRRRQHPSLRRLANRELVLGELVLAHRLRRRQPMMMMIMMMMVKTISRVQLALLVRLRIVS